MSSSNDTEKKRGNWTPVNIISVILGIVIFWPVGLFLLVWVLMDRDVVEIGHWIAKESRSLLAKLKIGTPSASGNRVFDEYQQTQLDRVTEIKKEVKERKQAFDNYKAERDRDIEKSEFEDFMKKKPAANDGSAPAGSPQ